jgi:hypothetical protein
MGSNESAREKRMLLVCDQHAEMKMRKLPVADPENAL